MSSSTTTPTSTRAQAKESIAEAWHQRRQSKQQQQQQQQQKHAAVPATSFHVADNLHHHNNASNNNNNNNSNNSNDSNLLVKDKEKGLPSLCVLIQKAWDRALMTASTQKKKQICISVETQPQQAAQADTHKSTNPRDDDGDDDDDDADDDSPNNNSHNNNGRHPVFPSILPILQAHVLAQQVEYLQREEIRQQQQQQQQQFDCKKRSDDEMLHNNQDDGTDDDSHDDSTAEVTTKQVLLNILPSNYSWDQAVQKMARSRSRAFWLIDLAGPIGRLVRWQRLYGGNHHTSKNGSSIRFLYRISANADATLLNVLERLPYVGLVVQSNWDLEQCSLRKQQHQQREQQQQPQQPTDDPSVTTGDETAGPTTAVNLYDDSTSTSRPDSYLRRAILGTIAQRPIETKSSSTTVLQQQKQQQQQQQQQLLSTLTVDGPDEVDRITQALDRLGRRRGQLLVTTQQPTYKVNFLLKLPATKVETWSTLTAATLERVEAVGSKLAGISVDLQTGTHSELAYRQVAIVQLLQTIPQLVQARNEVRVDLTGISNLEADSWWWQSLPNFPQVGEVTVDVTEPLIATSGALCTRIIGVKTMPDERQHYYIDDGCYGSLYQARDANPLPLVTGGRSGSNNGEQRGLYASTVWGPTCDGLDRVCPHVELPALSRDDWLVFPRIRGNSGEGTGTAFNGFCPPDTVYCVLRYFQ